MDSVDLIHFEVTGEFGKKLKLTSPSEEGVKIFSREYRFCGEGINGFWELHRAVVMNGIDWPSWWGRYGQWLGRYRLELAGAPLMDEFEATETEWKKEMWRRYGVCMKTKAPGHDSTFFPDNVEAEKPVNLSSIWPTLSRLTPMARWLYVVKSSHLAIKMSKEEASFRYRECFDELVENRLIVMGEDVPVENWAHSAEMKDLRSCLKELDLKPEKNLRSCRRQLVQYMKVSRHARSIVRGRMMIDPAYAAVSPPGLSWREFQWCRGQTFPLVDDLFETS